MPHDQQMPSLEAVLSAAAAELQHAYDRGLRLESAILQLLARNPEGCDMTELQHLDMVLQHVSAIGEVLGSIARSPTDPTTIAGALDNVKLADVRDRLLGVSAAASGGEGDLDLLSEDAA